MSVLLVVESAALAQQMQRFIGREAVTVVHPFACLAGYRFTAAYVRWPSEETLKRRNRTAAQFQDWCRQEVSHRLKASTPGGKVDFSYI